MSEKINHSPVTILACQKLLGKKKRNLVILHIYMSLKLTSIIA